jgi:hypothetical protein
MIVVAVTIVMRRGQRFTTRVVGGVHGRHCSASSPRETPATAANN